MKDQQQLQGWSPEAFSKALLARKISHAAFAARLSEYGVAVGPSAVRAWKQPGSPGPKTQLSRELVVRLLAAWPERTKPTQRKLYALRKQVMPGAPVLTQTWEMMG